MSAMLELSSISKIYGSGNTEVRALNNIKLEIDTGEFVAMMGPSGSGKSTCMNILGGLDKPTVGEYRFCGVNTSKLSARETALLRRNYIGFVFQSFNLLARTTAAENVELPLIYKGVPRKERRARALEALDQVGLADRANHTSAELSGGQQQRVAIARALVSKPILLFADEPTGNLDTSTTHDVISLLQDLNSNGLTVVMVTHEPEVAAFTKRVVWFVDGKIHADGPPSEVLG